MEKNRYYGPRVRLVVYDSGDIQVEKTCSASQFTDGKINIEEGNICGVNNLEIDNMLYVDGTLEVNGEIKGKTNSFIYLNFYILSKFL